MPQGDWRRQQSGMRGAGNDLSTRARCELLHIEIGTDRENSDGQDIVAVSAAAFIVACVAGWAAIPTSQARVAPAATLDPMKMMTSAKQMPPDHFADYSFVFN
jgi:hypothetical protein